MDKLRMETADLTRENIEKIGEMFPNCMTEKRDENGKLRRAVNFEMLRQMLSSEVLEGDEAYEFTWVGKKASIVEANKPIRKTLRPCKEESKDWDTTENLYIEGDNLDVLKLLQESYLGKVKMIYIDPPYNTGNDFIYRDDFKQSREEYEDEARVVDEDGDRLVKNTETNGRFHSDWCSMIYPRLVLARNILAEEGVIFISIDDNEQENLKKICDEVFGSENRLSTHHVQVRYTNKTLNEKNDWQPVMEYVLIYAKNAPSFHPNKPSEDYSLDAFKYKISETGKGEQITVKGRKVDVFRKGEWSIEAVEPTLDGLKETWVSGSIYSGTGNGTMVQNVIEPRLNIDGYGSLYKIYGLGEDGLGYRYFQGPQKEGANRSKMFSAVPLIKREEIERGTAKKYKSISNIYDFSPDFGNIRQEGGIAFNSGKKPVKMLKELLNYCMDKDALVMDFFSGSATTAHAVMQLNAEDGGNRKFIMVQLPEVCAEGTEAAKAGFKTICDIGKERIRRAGEKIKAEAGLTAQNLDIGFRVLKLDDTNMNDVYYAAGDYTQDLILQMESNIKPDRTDMDLLYGCLLDWGLPLSMPHTHEKIDGFTVHTYNDGDLIACFEERISEKAIREIASRKPLRAVFRDSCFMSAPEKINVFEIFKLLAPDTKVKVI